MNIAAILRQRANDLGAKTAYTYLNEDVEECISYQALDETACRISRRLQRILDPGDRAVLLYPPGLSFVSGLFGCFYSRAIAVPTYPPARGRSERHLNRLHGILVDARPKVILCNSTVLAACKPLTDTVPKLRSTHWLNTDELVEQDSVADDLPCLDEHAPAFLQYTSGSTTDPKGVIVTHRNLMHNLQMIRDAFGHSKDSRGVIWLPAYHDMGLIGGILQPLYAGFPVVLMSPAAFLQKPYAWLRAISNFRATTSGGPDSAYALCVQRVTDEQKASLDLSCWTVAFSGAEPVRLKTIDAFAEAFGRCGFQRDAFLPCYGLAEATLMVTGFREGAKAVQSLACSKAALEKGEVKAAREEPRQNIVACGAAAPPLQIKIVNPETRIPVAYGGLGEIWVTGPSVAAGYWEKPELSQEVFGGTLAEGNSSERYLRTGDLGFVMDGKLYVAGRIKDLIIIRGVNYYAHEIESTVSCSHPALAGAMGAAFSIEVEGDERLVVAHEVNRHYKQLGSVHSVMAAVRAAVAREHALTVHAVALIKQGRLPKTSNGKIQRSLSRDLFLKNELDVIESDISSASETLVDDLRPAALADLPADQRRARIESYLRELLRSVLNCDAVLPSGEFDLYEAGLDSLMLVNFQHRISQDMGIDLPYLLLYEMHSVGQLAVEICRRLESGSAKSESSDRPAKLCATYPLSYNQKALWFLYRLAPEDPAYNIATAAQIAGDLNREALFDAFRDLVRRHDSLRARLVEDNGEVVQTIISDAPSFIKFEDASDWDQETLDRELRAAAVAPFDLQKEVPVRVHLWRRGPRDHLLVWVTHHIVSDLWSFGVLFAELEALYGSWTTGRSARLFSPAKSYSEYVCWQRELLDGPEGARLRDFWKKQLTTMRPLTLPGRRELAELKPSGATYDMSLDPDLTRSLREVAAREGLTLNELLLATLGALLYCYTGQEKLAVGMPSSGRAEARFANLVGYCVNPLLIAVELQKDMSFAALCRAVKRSVREAVDHQNFPFPLALQSLAGSSGERLSTGIQIMFAFHRAERLGKAAPFLCMDPATGVQWGNITLHACPIRTNAAQFELTVTAFECEKQIRTSWQYRADLFEASAMEQMARHWKRLLAEIVKSPEGKLLGFQLLSSEERKQLLHDWNDTLAEYPRDKCVHQLFEQQVERSPDSVAVVAEGERLTYRELNNRANQLAHRLRDLAVGPDTRVGICIERSTEMVVGLMAILKAGGAYVPMDPAYPEERLISMAMEGRLTLLLTERRFAERFSACKIALLSIDADWDPSRHSVNNPVPIARPEDLIYSIYTSGSTGLPKAAGVYHGAFTNLVNWFVTEFKIDARDKVLLASSLSFDLTQKNIYAALIRGGELHLLPNGFYDPLLMSRLIGEHGITLLNCTPSAFYPLLEQGSGGPWPELASLRCVFLGGEPISIHRVRPWLQSRECQAEIVNTYGPTECTDIAAFYRMNGAVRERYDVVPIGKPIHNVQVLILNEQLELCPVGVVGELYVGGLGVGAGYLNDISLTAEKFVPNPFDGARGGRLYRTGDLGKYQPDGNIVYLGRTDHQVKLRGFRIELAEIENCLNRHEMVHESVVILREDQPGDTRLVAYVRLKEGSAVPSPAELRRYVTSRLPDHMVPAAFVVMDKLPLTVNGKVDRKALPAPEENQAAESQYEPPRTPIEEALVQIVEEVLNQKRIGIHDNFFHLGGNSLLMTRVVNRIRDRFDVEVPMGKFFGGPTVALLANLVLRQEIEKRNANEISALINQLENLSEDQVEERLRKLAAKEDSVEKAK